MNKYIAILALLTAAISAAASDTPSDKSTAKKKPAKTAAVKTAAVKTAVAKQAPAPPVAQPLTIPKDAVPNPDGTYSYSDKSGKKWIFSNTPFGISRREDTSGAPAALAAPDKAQYVKATDNGDTVKFVRQTPFGTTNWEKKKTDLNDDERRILEAQQPKPQ